MGMIEINYVGRQWTWANNREGEGFIEERLDRFFASPDWFLLNVGALVAHVDRSASDHTFLVLQSQPHHNRRKNHVLF